MLEKNAETNQLSWLMNCLIGRWRVGALPWRESRHAGQSLLERSYRPTLNALKAQQSTGRGDIRSVMTNHRATIMNDLVSVFVAEIIAYSPSLRGPHQDMIRYWAPDEPPVTTLLAALGDGLIEDFDAVSMATNEALFLAIENALSQTDEYLATVVATGMVEAMVTTTDRLGNWSKIWPMFGPISLAHARAWRDFGS